MSLDDNKSPVHVMNISLSTLEKNGTKKDSSYENLRDPVDSPIPKSADPNVIEFAEGDPECPYNWPKGRKIGAVLIFSGMAFLATMASTIVAPATIYVTKKFGTETEVSMLDVCLMVLGWATGPLFFAPASEIWGRNMVYIPTWGVFVLLNIGSALASKANTIGGYLICRFLGGVFASPIMAMAPASIYDIFVPTEAGPPSLIVGTLGLIGSVVGEVTGGYIAQYIGWRWALWIVLISTGVHFVACCFLPESHHNTILARKAKRMREEMGLPTLHTSYDNHSLPKSIIFRTAIFRPLQLLALEPIVFCTATALGFVWGVLYLYLGAYLIMFKYAYGWDAGNSGAAFGGIGVGMLLSIALAPSCNRIYLRLNEKYGNGGIYPEGRLPPAMVAMVLIPGSMFWFAWTCHKDYHWIVPVLSGIPYGIGQILLFISFLSYTVDCFPTMTASAGAASSLFRLLFAMGFPLFAPTLYDAFETDKQWAGSILAFGAVALMPTPFIFYKFGPYLRSKSRFAPKYT